MKPPNFHIELTNGQVTERITASRSGGQGMSKSNCSLVICRCDMTAPMIAMCCIDSRAVLVFVSRSLGASALCVSAIHFLRTRDSVNFRTIWMKRTSHSLESIHRKAHDRHQNSQGHPKYQNAVQRGHAIAAFFVVVQEVRARYATAVGGRWVRGR